VQWINPQRFEGRKDSSFLKKRSKKLLQIGARGPIPTLGIGPRTPTDKSLFASFSADKEESFSLSKQRATPNLS
jgi:hypothetical protein